MSDIKSRPYIGGQAVLEGVMMRSPRSFSVVVRRRNGEIVVRERAAGDARKGAATWPFLRGVASLVESIKLGHEALRFSADIYEKDLDSEGTETTTTGDHKGLGSGGLSVLAMTIALLSVQDPLQPVGARPQSPEPHSEPEGGGGGRKLISILPVIFAVALFVALPQAAAALTSRWAHWNFDVRAPQFQALTGTFKLAIVVGYLLLLRRVPDIRRIFQYHGAEHKTISTYEAGEELTVDNARRKTTLHPRCGTTFLVMVALVSIFVFSAIGPLLPRLPLGGVGGLADNVAFFLLKLPFLPVIASVTFELQRVFAKYCTTGPLRALLMPGFAVQKITTIEPDDSQLEVALASLRATLWREQAGENVPTQLPDRSFSDFGQLVRDPGYAQPT